MTRTITDLAWPRRTQRLTLRLARVSDLGAAFAYRSGPRSQSGVADQAKGTQAEIGWGLSPAHRA